MSRYASVEDVRASLLNLAVAYERLADAAEFDLAEHLSAANDTLRIALTGDARLGAGPTSPAQTDGGAPRP
jgi:hypothetical protein